MYSGTATAETDINLEDFIDGYFSSLPSDEEARTRVMVNCAESLCLNIDSLSDEELEAVEEGSADFDSLLRRTRLAAEILEEQNITTAIDSSMFNSLESGTREATRFIPLLGGLHHLLEASCKVQEDDPESIEDFTRASLTFGIEVALWSISAPYQIAFAATRYISNVTLVRLLNRGCNRCVATAMSEIHWAIRGTIHGEVIADDTIEFVQNEMERLHQWIIDEGLLAEVSWDSDLLRSETIERILDDLPSESDGGFWPEIEIPDFNFDFPELPDLDFSLDDWF